VRLARWNLAGLTTAALLFAAGPARAYRPFDGTDADVAELGKFELELGPVHPYTQGGRSYLIAPATVLNLGIFENTELVVDFSDYVALNPGQGDARLALLDTDVLVKHVFLEGILQGKTGPSLAAEAGPLVPEINGTQAFGASLDVITSYRWSFGTLHWNEWGEYTRERNASLFTGLILEGPYRWVVRPVAELYYLHEWNVGDEESVLLGAIWQVRESFALDIGTRYARIESENAGELRLGLTWSIPVWEPGQATQTEARLAPQR
jgi:hypothetical protein